MKCAACGYEGEFKDIGITDYSVRHPFRESLYACPTCGTVKIEEEKG